MHRILGILGLLLATAGAAQAHGLLIPEEKALPPLAMLNHKVTIAIDDQVATTRVEQTFRNHTDRQLEATYVFPVPKGASVNKFTMWIDGKETHGELVEADKARSIYTSIVRRTQDPGLLEYIGNNLLQMKVFPVPARGDQKVALSYTSVAPKDTNLVEYIYPLKTDGKATATLEEFGITATIKSQHGVTNVYSPTHAITLKRKSDNEVAVTFDRSQGLLDKDFQMFYSTSDKDIGLTALTHRPLSTENGYVSLLISPKFSIAKEYQVPRDMILVLDTSGSMRGPKMDQARNALKYCLKNLTSKDRFALINFATTVNRYRDKLHEATTENIEHATKWVEALEATGGTAINDALASALDFRSSEDSRSFNVVFFTDGQPTIGETNVDKIMKNTMVKNTTNTRIFTFGVGDDVNATFLDQLAEQTRALSTYVRPAEDIEAKVSGLYSKISNPVLTNLKLTTTGDVSLLEMYPPQLPDLFHGTQLVVMARYNGKGPSALRLTGQVGKETKEFVYEMDFPGKTGDDKNFVEQLWARRKVGYMLDQIRANGEKKELVDEVVSLAKKYGITTPYTSWLIVPDGVVPVVNADPKFRAPLGGRPGAETPQALAPTTTTAAPRPVVEFLKEAEARKPGESGQGGLGGTRGDLTDRDLAKLDDKAADGGKSKGEALEKKRAYETAMKAIRGRDREAVQTGKLGVDLSVQMQNLRNQSKLDMTALKNVQGRNVMELGGVWVDEGFKADMKVVVVKAQSDAYFRILERHEVVKDVYRLGNHLVWITPSGTALVVDCNDGKDKLEDAEIDKLFVAAQK
jgi:Ca-activated chloride channel homolog